MRLLALKRQLDQVDEHGLQRVGEQARYHEAVLRVLATGAEHFGGERV